MGENIGRMLRGFTMKERGGISLTRLDREREAVVYLFSNDYGMNEMGVDGGNRTCWART